MKISLKTDMSDVMYEAYKKHLNTYYDKAVVAKEGRVVTVKYEANTVQCMEVVSITNLYCLSADVPVWD